MHDATQSYGQSANNAMLARPGTYPAFHGRTQFTANNSLFGFMLKAPDWGRLHSFGQFEVDFFGVQPSDALEQQAFTTPAVRMRLFYFRLRQDFFTRASVDLLVGQFHDLFGWGGAGFFAHSIAFLGIAGEVYRRAGVLPHMCAPGPVYLERESAIESWLGSTTVFSPVWNANMRRA